MDDMARDSVAADPTTKDRRLIAGFRISGFRSLYEQATFCDLDRVNLIIGPNNSGKSNVLRFLESVLSGLLPAGPKYESTFADLPRGSDEPLGVGVLVPGTVWSGPGPLTDEQQAAVGEWTDSVGLTRSAGSMVWLDWSIPYGGRASASSRPEHALPADLFQQLRNVRNAIYQESHFRNVLANRPDDWSIPPIVSIPAFRSLGEATETAMVDWSGSGLIERLAQLQNPAKPGTRAYEAAKGDWSDFRAFVAGVLEAPDLTIEVPRDEDTIHVTLDGRTMRIEALGSGIHQLIMVAAACILTKESLILVEEPEVHLHPLLLRKLGVFLEQQTSNQYLIATHSPHLIDLPNTKVFRTRMLEGRTLVEAANRSQEVLALLGDLGYRASDVLQANCVIWVEGPSDRIYLRYWIGLMDPELIIDVHYSIMFYGGSNIRSVSGATDETALPPEFIRLRRINQYSALVADSDKRSAHDPLKADLEVAASAFSEGDGFLWITDGREVENYIPPETMLEAIREDNPKAKRLMGSGDPYECRYSYVGGHDAEHNEPPQGKPELARAVVRLAPRLQVLDLEERIADLARFVRRANGIPASSQASSAASETGEGPPVAS